jgi:hypothetical protein
VRDKPSDAALIFLLFAASTALCIVGFSPPVPFAPDIGGACGPALTCVAGHAVVWFGVWLVLVAFYWFFPDR